MGLNWNEIKSRALLFSKTWGDASNEDSLAKPFWIAFFEIFGITNKRSWPGFVRWRGAQRQTPHRHRSSRPKRARWPRPICQLVTGRPLRPTDHAPGPAQSPTKTRHRLRRRLPTQRPQKKSYASDAERVAFLFELYQRITSLLPVPAAKKTQKLTLTEVNSYDQAINSV